MVSCQGSKSMYKRGAKLEEAGLTTEAANFYITALHKNRNNSKAIIGLKKAGQSVLEDKLSTFYQLYAAGKHKEAVYQYVDAEAFVNKVKMVGVVLYISNLYQEDFEESKALYLTELYAKAEQQLLNENFKEAELLLREIKNLDPNFKDIDELSNFAFVEPKYRQAMQAYDNSEFRTAYKLFEEVNAKTGGYKESKVYASLALESAQYTIGIMPIQNGSNIVGLENGLYASIIKEIQKLNDPFLKIIDRSYSNEVLQEQYYNVSGAVNTTNAIKTGTMLGTKAILVGNVIRATRIEGDLKKISKTGWLAREVIVVDPVSKVKTVTYQHSKVYYYIFTKQNKVTFSYQYQLISTTTGEVLLSDMVELTREDDIAYASFDGDSRMLFAGTWNSQTRPNANDRRYDTPQQKRELDALFRANRNIKSTENMISEVYDYTGKSVAKKIGNFNPDK